MKRIKPINEQRILIPTPLAAKKNIKKIGLDINDQIVSVDFLGNAKEVNNVSKKPVDGEFEPSAANIIVNKIGAIGTDFKSMSQEVMINDGKDSPDDKPKHDYSRDYLTLRVNGNGTLTLRYGQKEA